MAIEILSFYGTSRVGGQTPTDASAERAYTGSVDGNLSILAGQSVTLTVTDFDAASTYAVTAARGSAALVNGGRSLSYQAPQSGGEDTLSLTVAGFTRHIPLVIGVGIATPAIANPVAGATGVEEQPVLMADAFASTATGETQAAIQFQIKTASGSWSAPTWDSGEVTGAGVSLTVPALTLLDGLTAYVARVRRKGSFGDWSAWSAERAFTTKTSFAAVIGIVLKATGGGAGSWVRVDADFNELTDSQYAFGGSYYSTHPVYSQIAEVTIDGQYMVKVPAFWAKFGTVPAGAPNAGKLFMQIAERASVGFSRYPAFKLAGADIAQFWVGKYQGTDDGGTRLGSQPGVLPLVNVNYTVMETRAAARNTGGVSGFMRWDIYQLSAIRLLMLIEMGTANAQAVIGNGRVSQSSAANTDAADVAQATWRGIVGLWGNVWQSVSGLKRNGGKWWLWDTAGNRTFVDTGQADIQTAGYPVTLNQSILDSYGVIIPASVDASSANGSLSDYFYSNASIDDRIAYSGGYWGDGASAGPFHAHVINVPSVASSVIGGRLAKV